MGCVRCVDRNMHQTWICPQGVQWQSKAKGNISYGRNKCWGWAWNLQGEALEFQFLAVNYSARQLLKCTYKNLMLICLYLVDVSTFIFMFFILLSFPLISLSWTLFLQFFRTGAGNINFMLQRMKSKLRLRQTCSMSKVIQLISGQARSCLSPHHILSS